jgi:FkbM family methyltransferase
MVSQPMKTFDWHIGKLSFRMLFATEFMSDRTLLAYANSNTLPEPEVMNFMLRAIKPGDVVIDGGASIGFFTLLMSRLVGSEGKVYAFEPHPRTVHRLLDNIGINQMLNVEVHNEALGAMHGVATLAEADDDGQACIRVGGTMPVKMVTLDALRCLPSLIKLDIEGSELEALEGAYKLLKASSPFVICELNAQALQAMGASVEELRKRFLLAGYDTFLLPERGEMPVFVPSASKLLPKRANTNVLFAPFYRMSELYPVIEVP